MNWKSHTAYLAAFAVVLACALIAGRQWAEHVRDDAKARAEIDADKKQIDALEDEKSQLKQSITVADKVRDTKLSDLRDQLAEIKRDHVAVKREIEAVTGPASDWQDVVIKPAPGSPITSEGLVLPMPGTSDAPSTSKGMTLNDDQQLKLAETLNGCKQTEVENDTCQLESSLKTELLAKADEQVKAAKDGMNAALKASKGGAWYQRTWRVIKPIGCGAAGAGLGALIAGAKGAVIGSAGSGVGCAIFGR